MAVIPRPTLPRRRRSKCQGFTYVAVLIAIAVLSLGLSTASEVWTRLAYRERLDRLDAIGHEYMWAIAQYYAGTPGIVVKAYPPTLQAMLLDSRFPFVRRYLRRVYANPFSGKVDWVLIRAPDGGVRGIEAEFRDPLGEVQVRRYVFTPGGPV